MGATPLPATVGRRLLVIHSWGTGEFPADASTRAAELKHPVERKLAE